MTVASLFAEIGLDTSPMTGAASDVRRKLQPLQQSFQQIGSTLTQYVTLPLAGLAGVATKTGAAIDREFAQIEGLVGESREALQGMRGDLFDISTATGVGPEELAEALFFVESAGKRGSEAIQVLEQSAKAAAAGLGETRAVADAVTSAVNAYGQEMLSAQRATDVLVSTVREGKVAADSISSSLGRVLGPASQMGVEFNEVGGTLASLTRVGASANRAVTALSAVLRTALKPTQQGREALDDLSLSYEELRASISDRGLLPTLQTLRKRFDETDVRITDLFRNARALRGVFGLLGKNAEQVESVFASMNTEVGGSTQEAFGAARDTIGNQFNRVLRQAQQLLDGVYTTFRSQIISVLKTAQSALETLNAAWDSMSSTMQGVVVATAAVAAALGPVLLVVSGIMAILPALTAALAALGTAAPYVAALGAVAVGVQQNWEALSAFFTSGAGAGLWDAIKSGAETTWEALETAFSGIVDAIGIMWDAIGDAFEGGGGILSLIGTEFTQVVRDTIKIVEPIIRQIGNTIEFLAEQIGRNVSIIVDLLTGDFAGAWDTVKESFSEFKDFFLRWLANVAEAIIGFVERSINWIPRVDVQFSGLRQTITDWRKQIGKDTDQVQKDFGEVLDIVMEMGDEVRQMGEQTQKSGTDVLDIVMEMANEVRQMGEQARVAAEEIEGLALSYDELRQRYREATKSVEEGGQAEVAPPIGVIEAAMPDQIDRLPVDPEEVERLQKRVDEFWDNFSAKAAITGQVVTTTVNTIGRGFQRLIEQGQLLGTEIENIGDVFVSLGDLVKSVIKQIIADLAAAAAQAAVFVAITGGTGGAGGFVDLIGAFMGGGGPSIQGRATGGPVTAGESYVVGENEPELFTPGTSGRITPMSDVSRGTGRLKVELVSRPEVLPNGDVQFAVEEGGRQQRRRGFPDEG